MFSLRDNNYPIGFVFIELIKSKSFIATAVVIKGSLGDMIKGKNILWWYG